MVVLIYFIDTTDKEAEIDSGDIHSEDYEITEKFEMVSKHNTTPTKTLQPALKPVELVSPMYDCTCIA